MNVQGGFQQFLVINLEQLVPRVHHQDLFQLLAGVVVPQETGIGHHRFHLAPQQGNLVRTLVVDPGGVQAQEPVFANHLPLVIKLLDRDVVGIGRSVHPGTLGGLGKDEDVLGAGHFLPRALGHLAQPHLVRTLVVDPQNPQLGIGHPLDDGALAVLGEVVFVITQKGKAVLRQPLEKGPCLFPVLIADFGGRGVQFLNTLLDLLGDQREIVNGDADFVQHALEHLLQFGQVPGIAVPVDFQHDKGFVVGLLGGPLAGMQFLQLAAAITVHLQHRMVNGVDTDLPLVDGNPDGVDQKRYVRVQDKNDGMG